jgi:hypothetical protein
MRWLLRLFNSLLTWWRNRKRRRAFSGVAQLESSIDPTSELAAWKLVLIGSPQKPKWLRLNCPCGCGDVIALNLMTSHRPHWSVQLHDNGTLTVMPSVDSKNCGSHFWIRRNKIDWV